MTTTRLLGLLLGLLLPATAAADPVDDALAKLQAAYQDVASVEADFVQTSTGMSYMEPLVQKGTLALERPGSMAWRFTEPRVQAYLSDGTTLWIVDEGEKTCTIYPRMDGVLARYFDFLTGMADVKKHFAVTLSDDGALVLKPTDPNDTLGTIEVRTDPKTGLVASIRNTNPFGDQTDVVLSNVRTGRDIPDADFVWTPREGYREIQAD